MIWGRLATLSTPVSYALVCVRICFRARICRATQPGKVHWIAHPQRSYQRILPDPTQCLEALICAGADVNGCGKRLCTPLHFAAHDGHEECVQLLLREGADVHASNEHLNMPLHMAASWGHVK